MPKHDRDSLEERYAVAHAAAVDAALTDEKGRAAASQVLLDALLKKPLDARFKALGDSVEKLIRPHRRTLMRSLQSAAPEKRSIAVSTATRAEIWRSRLPYRVFPLAVTAIATMSAFVFVTIAYVRTPREWVKIAASQPFRATWIGPHGELSDITVLPGNRYALVRIIENRAILRSWIASDGYGEFSVPAGILDKDP